MININGTDRTNLIEKFENNGYIEFFRTHRNDLPAHINPAYRKQYYDIDEFNIKFSRLKCGLTVCHVNIRRIAKNKPKLLAFLSTITRKFDVILLSEIGDNAKHFLNDQTISTYKVFAIDTPKNNKYGGTAILVKNGIGTVTPKDELKIEVNCQCRQCAVESSWIELNTGQNKYILSAIYRHCNGSVKHFNEQLDNSLQKLDKKTIAIVGGDTNINILDQNPRGYS